jgi:uncharacterized membrane protein YphA (DoxX/SURF4 family)
MKKILFNKYLILIFRLIIGFIFIYASIWKIVDPESFARSIENYHLFPVAIINLIALILPWLELLLGFFIILGLFLRTTSLLVSILMSFFTILVLSVIFRNLDISCGCYSSSYGSTQIGWNKFLENLALTLISLMIYLSANSSFTLENYFKIK